MFEFRLRILDVRERDTDPPSFLGTVEGFPQVMAHAASVADVFQDLLAALGEYLTRIQEREVTQIDWDEFPTVRQIRVPIGPITP
jgi:predicted RNase H-like HicB family nuclease